MDFKESIPVDVFERLLKRLRIKSYRARSYRDLFFYFLFFVLFMVIVFGLHDTRRNFYVESTLQNVVGSEEFRPDQSNFVKNFFDIRTKREFWQVCFVRFFVVRFRFYLSYGALVFKWSFCLFDDV